MLWIMEIPGLIFFFFFLSKGVTGHSGDNSRDTTSHNSGDTIHSLIKHMWTVLPTAVWHGGPVRKGGADRGARQARPMRRSWRRNKAWLRGGRRNRWRATEAWVFAKRRINTNSDLTADGKVRGSEVPNVDHSWKELQDRSWLCWDNKLR